MKIHIPIFFLLAVLLIAACQPTALPQNSVESATAAPSIMGTILASTPVPPILSSDPSAAAPPVETEAASPIAPSPETTLMPPLEEIPPEAQPLIDLAIQALARKTGIPAGQIQVLQATAVTWKDASLGCPKPGVDYMRVETPGYNILLEARGSTYPFHTDLKDRVVQCASMPPGDIFLTP